mmetsp:Transcript_33472/g.55340  ORF Transcript_33472/g.55340 Transcript_33472/m.55340 type:complete len:217 (+) Transcript_33472:503-1153(+)
MCCRQEVSTSLFTICFTHAMLAAPTGSAGRTPSLTHYPSRNSSRRTHDAPSSPGDCGTLLLISFTCAARPVRVMRLPTAKALRLGEYHVNGPRAEPRMRVARCRSLLIKQLLHGSSSGQSRRHRCELPWLVQPGKAASSFNGSAAGCSPSPNIAPTWRTFLVTCIGRGDGTCLTFCMQCSRRHRCQTSRRPSALAIASSARIPMPHRGTSAQSTRL